MGKRRIDPMNRVEAELMAHEGKSLASISKELGVSTRTLQRWLRPLRQAGELPMPKEYRPPIPQSVLDEAERMLKDRTGYAETARTLGIGKQNLTRRLPGYALSVEEKVQRARMGQVFNQIPGHLK